LKPPLIDLTAINGIESLFRAKNVDPWALYLIGSFTDFFVYSDTARFALPTRSSNITEYDLSDIPQLLANIQNRDSSFFTPEVYTTAERRILSSDYLIPAFNNVVSWALNNPKKFQQWVHLHNESWIRSGHRTRIASDYVYDMESLQTKEVFIQALTQLKTDSLDMKYMFDVILRYPFYGELTGPDAMYFAHPIREAQTLPTMQRELAPPLIIPLSFGDEVIKIAKQMTLDEYSTLIHQLRGIVRDKKIQNLKPNEVEPDIRRQIAEEVEFAPKLKDSAKALGFLGGIVAGVGAISVVGPSAAIVGGAISIASVLWQGTLPRSFARVKWLRWAYKWDIETQKK
jgi:hypothetical protein